MNDCPECARRKAMLFHLAQKLNVVMGLNEEELEFLESIGAQIEHENP